ncbi:hypothetical protein LTR95_005989 [Oleoguttula sp. CCFEE 5521]
MTVERIQALAPAHSSRDAAQIQKLIANKSIFAGLPDEHARQTIAGNLASLPLMIPSLYTFFEDIKFLEPCAKAMRSLLPSKTCLGTGSSIMNAWKGNYFHTLGTTTCLVEYAKCDTRLESIATKDMAFALKYCQLWLFALRNFQHITNTATRKDRDRDKPVVLQPSPTIHHAFGRLATDLGFRVLEDISLHSEHHHAAAVSQFCQQHGYDMQSQPHVTDTLLAAVAKLRNVRQAVGVGNFSGEHPLTLAQRCGRPFEGDHERDSPCMFLPQMHSKPISQAANISTFYRKWNMFRAFFGTLITEACSFSATIVSLEDRLMDEVGPARDATRASELDQQLRQLTLENQRKDHQWAQERAAFAAELQIHIANIRAQQFDVAALRYDHQIVAEQLESARRELQDQGPNALNVQSRDENDKAALTQQLKIVQAEVAALNVTLQDERQDAANKLLAQQAMYERQAHDFTAMRVRQSASDIGESRIDADNQRHVDESVQHGPQALRTCLSRTEYASLGTDTSYVGLLRDRGLLRNNGSEKFIVLRDCAPAARPNFITAARSSDASSTYCPSIHEIYLLESKAELAYEILDSISPRHRFGMGASLSKVPRGLPSSAVGPMWRKNVMLWRWPIHSTSSSDVWETDLAPGGKLSSALVQRTKHFLEPSINDGRPAVRRRLNDGPSAPPSPLLGSRLGADDPQRDASSSSLLEI